MGFEGKVIIVTGAASGIGKAIATELQKRGAKLALVDIDIEKLRQNFTESANTFLVQLDITKEAAVSDSIQKIEKHFGKIDILINSAGITGKTNTQSHLTDTVDVQKVFDINFTGSYLMAKYVIPHMFSNKYGRILHIASIAGKEGNAGMLAYSASKAAVIAMTKVQGKEYAETGITVNAIAPAVIQTPLVDAMPAQQVQYMTDKIPMKRCGTLDEIAQMACFIVSDENSFCTGFTFDLSGGRATY